MVGKREVEIIPQEKIQDHCDSVYILLDLKLGAIPIASTSFAL
ncbi:MAG: hypothetical protein ACM3N1_00060 [Accumulibacter sp.]